MQFQALRAAQNFLIPADADGGWDAWDVGYESAIPYLTMSVEAATVTVLDHQAASAGSAYED